MASTDLAILPKPKAILRDNPRPEFSSNPKANFFSLPQILRQKILYESLPRDAFRRLAQNALRISQLQALGRSREDRRPKLGQRDEQTYRFFIKRFCQRFGVHWMIMRDLVLVRKLWHCVFYAFDIRYDDEYPDSTFNTYKNASKMFFWSAEEDLSKLEHEYGLERTRAKALEAEGSECWARLKGLKSSRPNPSFERVSTWIIYSSRGSSPRLGYHTNKAFPSPTALYPSKGIMPPEIRTQILYEILSLKHLSMLTFIQYHYKRTGTRFIRALVLKLARVHPGFVPDLAYVEKQWVSLINDRIKAYRSEHSVRVEEFTELLKEKRNGEASQEAVDELENDILHKMYPWRHSHIHSSYDLMALEDIHNIPVKHRSPVTWKLRKEMLKKPWPYDYVGTIDGTYRSTYRVLKDIEEDREEAAKQVKEKEKARITAEEAEATQSKAYVPIHLRIIAGS